MDEKKPKQHVVEDQGEMLVRILGYDIPCSRNLFVGLTRIKGISWSVSNALCLQLGIPRHTKISELNKADIVKIEKTILNMQLPTFLKNRRGDPETGEDRHLLTNDLDMRKEFDIKRLKKIKSYRGIRHAMGQPVRGQRTRSHFRKKRTAVGVKKKKDDKKA